MASKNGCNMQNTFISHHICQFINHNFWVRSMRCGGKPKHNEKGGKGDWEGLRKNHQPIIELYWFYKMIYVPKKFWVKTNFGS